MRSGPVGLSQSEQAWAVLMLRCLLTCLVVVQGHGRDAQVLAVLVLLLIWKRDALETPPLPLAGVEAQPTEGSKVTQTYRTKAGA